MDKKTGERFDRVGTAQLQGRHIPNGFPHYSSRTGLCMCLDLCCQGIKGCRCKFCPCQYGINDHIRLAAISASTISSHGMDGENNGLPNHHPSGGRNNNGSKREVMHRTKDSNRTSRTGAHMVSSKESPVKIKIVINTRKAEEHGDNRAVIWEGELEILDKEEYLTMISMIGEGQPQPLCMIPFAIGIGHYLWIPPDAGYERLEGDYLDELSE